MKKKRKSNTPKYKKMKREARLQAAKHYKKMYSRKRAFKAEFEQFNEE